MGTVSNHFTSRTIDNIALAYFPSPENLHDAARDLCIAGFEGPQINIAASPRQDQIALSVALDQPLQNAIGAHTFRWRLNRLHVHDRQRRGADQIRGVNRLPPEGINPTCSTLDLARALQALAVSRDVIFLLQLDMKDKGTFLLVDAPHRVDEASAIMSLNAGYLRTQYLARTSA